MSADNIKIYALTDSHQEARKLCRLFSHIIATAPEKGKNTLICDGGDLFKGIYDRELCVCAYEELRRQLPEAKIVLVLGNNDFGFNMEQFRFLQETAKRFHQANIHVLCANLLDIETKRCPNWVDPYILLDMDQKKIMVTAFCVDQIRLQKYGLQLTDIPQTFAKMEDTIKHIEPDALIVLNHALYPSSEAICNTARTLDIRLDLLIGGHEHLATPPDDINRIYYPQAFSKTVLQFNMALQKNATSIKLEQEVNCKDIALNPVFEPPLAAFEKASRLNVEIAPSTLNLEKRYSDPCSLGTFIADKMREAAGTDIAMFSTGYISHALRYEKGKMLTKYNVERSFSAEVPLQTVIVTPQELKTIFNNAVRKRYVQRAGNARFLQCSQNITLVCRCKEDNEGEILQIFINGEPLLDEHAEPLHPEAQISCAIDPFIGSGEQGFDILKPLPKETLMVNNQIKTIKSIFIQALQQAARTIPSGSSYAEFKIIER